VNFSFSQNCFPPIFVEELAEEGRDENERNRVWCAGRETGVCPDDTTQGQFSSRVVDRRDAGWAESSAPCSGVLSNKFGPDRFLLYCGR